MKWCVPMSPEEKMTTCAELLISGASYIGQVNTEISLEQLESIANIRYALAVAADVLHRQPDISIIVDTVPDIVSQSSKTSSGGEYEKHTKNKQNFHSSTYSIPKLDTEQLQLRQAVKPAPPESPSLDASPKEFVPTDTPPAELTTSKLLPKTALPTKFSPSEQSSREPLITCSAPSTTESPLTELVSSEATSTQHLPFELQLAYSKSLHTKSALTEPILSESSALEPVTTVPSSTKPLSTKQQHAEPLLTEPLPTKLLPTKLLPSESLPTELLPAKPLLAEPLTSDNLLTEPHSFVASPQKPVDSLIIESVLPDLKSSGHISELPQGQGKALPTGTTSYIHIINIEYRILLFLGLLPSELLLKVPDPLCLCSNTLPSGYSPTVSIHTELLPTSFKIKGRDCASQLLLAAQSICKEAGPGNYLLKLIVRHYGFSFLRRLVKTHHWVVPSSLRWTGEV